MDIENTLMTAVYATEEAIKVIRKISNTLIHTPRHQKYLQHGKGKQRVFLNRNEYHKENENKSDQNEGCASNQRQFEDADYE
jgi:hypothetical protein